MSVLTVICARGGSKGLPRKNVLDLGGKPLIAWSVEAAQSSRRSDRVILSSDDREIIDVARDAGCEIPFIRPQHLAGDTASIYDVLFHALDEMGNNFDHVVLLQATSPLRLGSDIDACIGLCLEEHAPAALSVVKVSKPPQWMYTLDAGNHLVPAMTNASGIDRRQDASDYYVPNGAVYVASAAWLRENNSFAKSESMAYVMPQERSIDIDSHLDLLMARAIVSQAEEGERS